jgi:GT2 family glycosyltransferase
VHGRNAWAQSAQGINRETYARTVRFDAVLHAEFVALAARHGHDVGAYEQQPVPQWVENRMLSLRLAPERHPIAGDTVWHVARLGLRGAMVAPDLNVFGRATWMLWFVALAVLPVPWIVYLARRGRAQSRRSLLARILVRLASFPLVHRDRFRSRTARPDAPNFLQGPSGLPGAPLSPAQGRLQIVVAIATVGRPAVLRATLNMIARQTRAPDRILVAPVCDADLDDSEPSVYGFERVAAPRGLCAQRNAILARAGQDDLIIFFDDDFFPCRDYLAAVERAFLEEPDIVMTTGTVLFDDVKGPGLSVEAGKRMIEEAERKLAPVGPRLPIYNAYGCNMAFRLEPIRRGVLFDERLPLYGWLEDVDFSRRLAPFGRIVKLPDACGVHLGSKSGRTSGVRYGYSQIVNPLYMVRKGTMAPGRAWSQVWRNIAMNVARSPVPEAYVDRRGRLRGNVLGFIDAVRGLEKPEKINSLT